MIYIEDKKVSSPSRLLIINFIRIALLLLLISATISIKVFTKKPPFPILPIILVLSAALAVAIVNFFILRVVKTKTAVYLQIIADIIVITVLVYFSSGAESPFYFLYILPIIMSTIFLSRKDTIYIAALSFIIFGSLSELMYLEITPFFSWVADEKVQQGTFIYNLIMSMIAFSSVALISSYYFEKIKKTRVELKKFQEDLQQLDLLNRTVLEKMENGFLTCNSEGKVISYNEKSRSLLHINGKSNIFKLFLTKNDYNEIAKISELNNKYYFEREIEDSILGVSVSMLRSISSFDRVFVFIITDLTEKREIEKRLKSQEHLALIGEMSAGMAHEIRNPLASISGSVQFLRKEMEVGQEYQKLMDIIVKESDRLSRSIEEFLGFTKVTPLKKSHFKLGGLINEVVELAAVNKQEIDFIKKISEDDVIHADKGKIEQLIRNLVNNSVKALKNKGTIEINVYDSNDDTYLSIKDNGSGIDKSDLENIFNPFYSKFTVGIGLGMSIVKRIVEEHHFEIEINSEKNIGTEVIICFKEY